MNGQHGMPKAQGAVTMVITMVTAVKYSHRQVNATISIKI
jgi:hypothetical protein